MSPDDIKRMTEMAAKMGAGGGMPPAAAAAAGSSGGGAPAAGGSGRVAPAMPPMPPIDPSQMDPGMMAAAADMMDKMSPEELKNMMAMAGAANGMAVPDIDPAMLKASMAMMKNMVGVRALRLCLKGGLHEL